jgi:putative ABC transport system substrate-binding protein
MVRIINKTGWGSLARHAVAALLAAILIISQAAPAMAAPKTIGIIMTGDIPYYKSIHQAFTGSMKNKGDVKFVVQSPAPEPMSWTNAARKLVVIGSDMIVAYGAPATLTTMKESSSIPILFAGVYDPEAMRISGKNATGISSKVPMNELLKGLKSIKNFKNLGVVFNKAEKDTILQVKEIKAMEGSLGFKMKLFNAGIKDYAKNISGVDAILMTTSCSGMCGINDIISVARKQNLPTAATLSGGKGMIYTISADPAEQGQVLAEMAAKVFGGEDPASIPFRKASRLQRIVNLKEASAVGVTVPGGLTGSATEVIK